MRKLLLILFFLFLYSSIYAQTTIAKLNFEEAEEAYSKGEYEKALNKLALAEKNFGKINLPILYLRILSQDKMIKDINDVELIYTVKQQSKTFLNDYQNEDGIDEKYREVYKISEKYASYPSTKESLVQLKQSQESALKAKLQQVRAAWDKYIETVGGKMFLNVLTSIYTEDEGTIGGLKIEGKTWIIPGKLYSYSAGGMKVVFDMVQHKAMMYLHKPGSYTTTPIEGADLLLLRLTTAVPYETDEITNEKLISYLEEVIEDRKLAVIKIKLLDLVIEAQYNMHTGLKEKEKVWHNDNLIGTTSYKSYGKTDEVYYPQEYTTEAKGAIGTFTVKKYKTNQAYNEKNLRKP